MGKIREPLKNDGMQGDEELTQKPYEPVRRQGSSEIDTALRVFQRFSKTQILQVLTVGDACSARARAELETLLMESKTRIKETVVFYPKRESSGTES